MDSHFNMPFLKPQLTAVITQCASTSAIIAAAQVTEGQWINREVSGAAAETNTSMTPWNTFPTLTKKAFNSNNSILLPYRNTLGKMSLFHIVSI